MERDKIEQDQYAKIEVLTKSVSELTGAVSVLNKTNSDLVTTLKRSIFYQFIVIVFLILVIAYGAIGERGMYAVRETMPSVIQQGTPRSPAVPIPDGSGSQDAAIAPVPVNDLEKYINTKMRG